MDWGEKSFVDYRDGRPKGKITFTVNSAHDHTLNTYVGIGRSLQVLIVAWYCTRVIILGDFLMLVLSIVKNTGCPSNHNILFH